MPINSRPNGPQNPEQQRPLDPQEQRRLLVTGAGVGNALNALYAYCGEPVLDDEDARNMGFDRAAAEPAPAQFVPIPVPMPAGVVQPLPIEYQGAPQAMADVPPANPAFPRNPLFDTVVESPLPQITENGDTDLWDLAA